VSRVCVCCVCVSCAYVRVCACAFLCVHVLACALVRVSCFNFPGNVGTGMRLLQSL